MKQLKHKVSILLSLSVLSMGDPNFVPAGPKSDGLEAPLEDMVDTTSTINQLENEQNIQKEESSDKKSKKVKRPNRSKK